VLPDTFVVKSSRVCFSTPDALDEINRELAERARCHVRQVSWVRARLRRTTTGLERTIDSGVVQSRGSRVRARDSSAHRGGASTTLRRGGLRDAQRPRLTRLPVARGLVFGTDDRADASDRGDAGLLLEQLPSDQGSAFRRTATSLEASSLRFDSVFLTHSRSAARAALAISCKPTPFRSGLGAGGPW